MQINKKYIVLSALLLSSIPSLALSIQDTQEEQQAKENTVVTSTKVMKHTRVNNPTIRKMDTLSSTLRAEAQNQKKRISKSRNKCDISNRMTQSRMSRKDYEFMISKNVPRLLDRSIRLMNDPVFGLTNKQKAALTAIKSMMRTAIKDSKKIKKEMRAEIVKDIAGGAPFEITKQKIESLFELKASLVVLAVQSMEMTKDVLTKDQLVYLLTPSSRR